MSKLPEAPVLEGLRVYTDGASRGNPGEAGFGVIIQDEKGNVLEEVLGYLGMATNNVAEYSALVAALKAAKKYGSVKVEIFADSELMVRQMNGQYRVKSPNIAPLYQEARRLCDQMGSVTLRHIPREQNQEADAAANRAVDCKMR